MHYSGDLKKITEITANNLALIYRKIHEIKEINIKNLFWIPKKKGIQSYEKSRVNN